MSSRFHTLPTFNQNYLAHNLYTIPRIINENNAELLSKDLMQGFIWHGSETIDSINRYINVNYGHVAHVDFPKGIYGLKLKHHNILLSEIIEAFVELKIPVEVSYEFPELTQSEWKAGIKAITQVIKSFEKIVRRENTWSNGLRLRDRSISHKLYSASLIANGSTLALIRDSFRHDNIFEDEIDYDLVDYQKHFFDLRYGLCIKGKNILLSSLIHSVSSLPDILSTNYPFLKEQSGLDDIPYDFRWSHSGTDENPNDWVKNYGHSFPALWYVIPFTAYAVLSVFESQVKLPRPEVIPYFDIAIKDIGKDKNKVLAVIQEIEVIDLKHAQNRINQADGVIISRLYDYVFANYVKDSLEDAGATIEIRLSE